MQLDDYLQRIGYTGSREPNLETLSAIHRAHLTTIPYENLDIHLDGYLALDEAITFDKLVTRGRGGWCYEMNGLLGWALRELGYDVTLLSSDVGEFVGDGAGGDHLILRVNLEARPYLVDVGFGNGLIEPIPLEPGDYQQGFLHYRLLNEGDRWYFQNHAGPGFVFTLTPRTMDHFLTRCNELQTLPTSGFARTSVCHFFVPEGILTLRGAVLTEVTAQGTTQQIVDNPASYEQLLNSRFGLHLAPDQISMLWEKVWARHQVWLQENATGG